MIMLPDNAKLQHLKSQATLQEHRFRSDIPVIGPLIAWFRERWNNIATKWYIRPLIQQQNEFNVQVADYLAAQSQFLHILEADLAAQRAGLDQQRDALAAQAAQLAATMATHATQQAALSELTARSAEHDAWLSHQDRDQVMLTHSQAESGAQIIQMARQFDELEQRLAQLELSRSQAESPD